MNTKSVITAQKQAIGALIHAINSFIRNNNIRTRVIPLAIPTGWGKTRIALQGVLKASYIKKNPPSIIIWPQKHSHISKEVWKRPSDWVNNGKRIDDSLENEIYIPEIKYLKNSKKGNNHGRHERGLGNSNHKFNGTFYSVNNKFHGIENQLDKSNGPIIFIIDEWHTKKIIEKYQASEYFNDPESFWWDFLIGKKSIRKLFIILISATPIGTTSHMDYIMSEDDEDHYEEEIKDALDVFNDLTRVGNQNREYNLYKIYPGIIRNEENKLKRINNKEYFSSDHKKDFISEYVRLSKKAYKNFPKLVSPPSLVYALESLLFSGVSRLHIKKHFNSVAKYFNNGFTNQYETLKLNTLVNLIKKYPHKKFVIFCHYKAVANSVHDFLLKYFNCYYLEGDVKKNDPDFNSFNDPKGKTRLLIVTDEHSQGISLHKTEAWLIHFELSWNPIRIIQRYGRVWRINSKTKELTKPVAFYIPHSFSSEEEMIERLKRRWQVLRNLPNQDNTFVNLAPISFEVALGIRCTPNI